MAISFEDYVAITELKARYCRFLDTKDWQNWGDLFIEGCELDTRPAGGPVTRGRAAVLETVIASIGDAITAHQVHAPEIRLEGDTAHVVWAMQDRVLWPKERAAQIGSAGLTGFGHYTERYVREGGCWRIASTTLSRLHVDMDPLPAG